MLLLSYEIFDDIAFFYLAISIVAMAVIPWSCFKLGSTIYETTRKPELIPLTRIQKLKLAQEKLKKETNVAVKPITDGATTTPSASAAAASGLTQENLRPPKPWFTCANITLLLLWVLFFYMLLQIPNFKEQNLATFKPYEILGLEPKASDEEIKRAYRKQSLIYHPDRNSSPEAAQQFILIAKAYETLTSETAKANIEKVRLQ